MRLVLLSLAALSLTTLGVSRSTLAPIRIAMTPIDDARATDSAAAIAGACPAATIPDGDVCVRIPGVRGEASEDPLASENAHRERTGTWRVYEQIPRLPDRPADYDAYRYPVPPGLRGPDGKAHFVVSGYDLDRPDESQRRGRSIRAVGHGGVDLPDPRGTPIATIALDHQVGDADVVYAGPLFGTSVVTRHTVREAAGLRDYVLLFGHLDSIAPGVVAGRALKEGDVLGAVGDSGSPELVHLHLEARRVRDGLDVAARVKERGAGALLEGDATVVCDPRNVLPLR